MPSYEPLRKGLKSLRDDGLFAFLWNVGRFTSNRVRRHFRLRAYQRAYEEAMKLSTPEERFTKIFKSDMWGLWGDGESTSGTGSTVDATANIRLMLPRLIDRFGINSVFDAPCGDFNWMKQVVESNHFNYIGGDIVRELIERNNSAYGDIPRVAFVHFDITKDKFPDADIWLCRDCLFHLSYQDTFEALEKFADLTFHMFLRVII